MKATGALVALAVLLAGCTAPTSSDPTLDPSLRATEEEPLQPQGAPPPLRPSSPETAASPGEEKDDPLPPESEGTRWVRAYWGGASEVPLLQKTINESAGFLIFFGGWTGYAPDPDRLVAPGTVALVVTAVYAPPPDAPGFRIRFSYDNAKGGTENWTELPAGEAVEVPIPVDHVDPPLSASSSWRLQFGSTGALTDHALDPVRVDINVKVRRGPDLPTFGEPADPWGGGDRLALVADESRSVEFMISGGDEDSWFYSCLCEGARWAPRNGTLVPPGATVIEATLRWTNPLLSKPVLYATSASSNILLFELVEDGADVRAFRLVIDPNHVDSPYAPESAWELAAIFDEGASIYGTAAAAKLTLDAEVLRG